MFKLPFDKWVCTDHTYRVDPQSLLKVEVENLLFLELWHCDKTFGMCDFHMQGGYHTDLHKNNQCFESMPSE